MPWVLSALWIERTPIPLDIFHVVHALKEVPLGYNENKFHRMFIFYPGNTGLSYPSRYPSATDEDFLGGISRLQGFPPLK